MCSKCFVLVQTDECIPHILSKNTFFSYNKWFLLQRSIYYQIQKCVSCAQSQLLHLKNNFCTQLKEHHRIWMEDSQTQRFRSSAARQPLLDMKANYTNEILTNYCLKLDLFHEVSSRLMSMNGRDFTHLHPQMIYNIPPVAIREGESVFFRGKFLDTLLNPK